MALGKATVGLMALAILAAACSDSSSSPSSEPATATTTSKSSTTNPTPSETLRVDNRGDSMEGHTPRGFAGMGTGLFVGDNLNASFPEGDGLQMFLTFDLPAGLNAPISVELTSEVLNVSGTPFEDLGDLRVASISYTTFGRELFDLESDGETVLCSRVGDTALTCDVTDAVAADIAAGASLSQFRLRFDTPGDSDGSQDLAMFFRTDSNTNEPGLFVLEISS